MTIKAIKTNDKGETLIFTPAFYYAKDNQGKHFGFTFLNYTIVIVWNKTKQTEPNESNGSKR